MNEWLKRVEVVVGDITQQNVDAIVNAANESLLGGSGVDGAIHRAAGPKLLEHNRTIGGCATGKAKITPSFELESRGISKIIHTVGPVWGTDPRADGTERLGYRLEDNQLGECYQNCLELARDNGIERIAFPAVSTGVYGFPKDRAVQIAVGHVRAFIAREHTPKTVVFCCFSEADAAIYRAHITPVDYEEPIQIGD